MSTRVPQEERFAAILNFFAENEVTEVIPSENEAFVKAYLEQNPKVRSFGRREGPAFVPSLNKDLRELVRLGALVAGTKGNGSAYLVVSLPS